VEGALAVVNQMERDGVIGKYAIGDAIAATRYIEPIQTYDLDIFVTAQASETGLLSISPIYSYLNMRGYVPESEAVMIEGWAVQFLPTYNALTEEAWNKPSRSSSTRPRRACSASNTSRRLCLTLGAQKTMRGSFSFSNRTF
jgi:hypothetical protein